MRTTLYIGVTNNLQNRLSQHRQKQTESFTQKYKLVNLIYYEVADTAEQAIAREKQLKGWHRAWKENLVSSINPDWEDLSVQWEESEINSE